MRAICAARIGQRIPDTASDLQNAEARGAGLGAQAVLDRRQASLKVFVIGGTHPLFSCAKRVSISLVSMDLRITRRRRQPHRPRRRKAPLP